jgi:L-cystine uptake protein TcyP (sodium:dicarboxylate symporter family)
MYVWQAISNDSTVEFLTIMLNSIIFIQILSALNRFNNDNNNIASDLKGYSCQLCLLL